MLEHQGGKYGALIRQAKHSKPDSQVAEKPENQKTRKPKKQTFSQVEPDGQVKEKQVNLCIKVPESWRRHWAIQAKIQDITMTDVMVEALTQRFGLPDNQTAR
jgi:spore coat polysaccharide biosynthesis protein SpsF (cytidylyltransferase family)